MKLLKGKHKWLFIILLVLMHLITFAIIAIVAKDSKKAPESTAETQAASAVLTETAQKPETPAVLTETAQMTETSVAPETEPTLPDETLPTLPPEAVLLSGTYLIATKDTGGPVVRIPILEIDAENASFRLYTLSDRESDKGHGRIGYADGLYTLFFDGSERTTEFSAEGRILTFLSKLYFGTAAYNYMDEQGNFLPFTAELFDLPPVQESTAHEICELTLDSGVYAVDISPLGIENVSSAPKDLRLYIDAAENTFLLYEKAAPSEIKNSGFVVPAENGGFELVFDKTGFVTPFEWKDGVISFTNFLYYGSSYLKNENYEFVPHTAVLTEEEAPAGGA